MTGIGPGRPIELSFRVRSGFHGGALIEANSQPKPPAEAEYRVTFPRVRSAASGCVHNGCGILNLGFHT